MSEYRADNGRYLTEGLFLEKAQGNSKKYVKYTMRPDDHNGLKSMYKLYMQSSDEYDAAIKAVGSYMHWQKLVDCDWFMNGGNVGEFRFEGLKTWREHMRLRDESVHKKQLQEEAENGSVTAQKALYDAHRTKPSGKGEQPSEKRTGSQVESLVDRFKVVKNG